jgi:pentatricopeptide repeat protein
MCCLGTLEDSKLVHERLCQNAPYKSDVLVGSNLVDMYANCGSNVGAWKLFWQMQQEGVQPDSVLSWGCWMHGKFPLEESRCVHEQITKSGWDSGVFVGSSLLDMYANCGCIKDACKVFNKMPSWHVVTWTAMILGCVKRSQGQKALELFWHMQQEHMRPNSVTFMRVHVLV